MLAISLDQCIIIGLRRRKHAIQWSAIVHTMLRSRSPPWTADKDCLTVCLHCVLQVLQKHCLSAFIRCLKADYVRSTMALPIIDISSYILEPFNFPPSPAQLSTSAQIHNACLEFGFFYITGLDIPSPELEEVLQLSKAFFTLPNAIKEELSITSKTNATDGARGYQRLEVGEDSGVHYAYCTC